MIKEIPQKVNHIIKGFKEIKPCNDDLPILYEPIYERVVPLNTVYWDNSRKESIYLLSDTQGIDCSGQLIKVDINHLASLSKVDQKMFHGLLSHNGYEIKDGKLLKFGCVYMTESCLNVIYLADGCHACDNTIVNSTPSRLADPFEEEAFFDCLNKNGFTYHPVNKCITESERYYYFPSYSLYNGFQPEKKKWVDSDADKFYDKHCETFDTFDECANWCNQINEFLKRDYAKI